MGLSKKMDRGGASKLFTGKKKFHQDYGGYNYPKKSQDMEAEAVSQALSWLVRGKTTFFTYAMILTDCKNIIDEINKKNCETRVVRSAEWTQFN